MKKPKPAMAALVIFQSDWSKSTQCPKCDINPERTGVLRTRTLEEMVGRV